MSDRFFSSQPIAGDRIVLDGAEAHHLLHVMRAKPGERIMLFDGSGTEFAAEIADCGRASVEVSILERREVDRELPFKLVVGVSLPKGDRQKWLVEKLTELGVTELVPLVTDRGVAQPTDAALERLARSAIEAAKQCGRNRLMRIAKPQAWGEWVASDCGRGIAECGLAEQTEIRNLKSEIESRRILASPGGCSLFEIDLTTHRPTQLAIGPEGGFTDAEVSAAIAAGWQTVSLGPRILRVETAAIALAAAVALPSG